MTIRLIFPFVLVLAACAGEDWAEVPPGTPAMECAAMRLAARGWGVDTAFTDSAHVRVFRIEGLSADTVTGEVLPPTEPFHARAQSDLWWEEDGVRRRTGSNLGHEVEVLDAMQSCGIDAYGTRP